MAGDELRRVLLTRGTMVPLASTRGTVRASRREAGRNFVAQPVANFSGKARQHTAQKRPE
eukprot:151584-Pleurochrysis_carterae.AAC.1